MREGWTYKKLGEVCDFEGGSQPPKSEWINHPQDGYVRMLQIRDFTKSRNAEIEYVKNTKKIRLCTSDDILIGRYGASVGKILTGLSGAYNVAIIKSIPNEKLITKAFIRRYFESSLFQNLLFKVCGSRAAQAGFSKDDIKNEMVPVPPLVEQQRIVSRLDSAFAHIDALKANAEKQLDDAKALFQKALEKAMGTKEGWEEKVFTEICDVVTDFVAAGSFADLRKNVVYKDLPDYAQLVRTTDLKHRFENKSFVYVNEQAFKYLYKVNLDEESIILPNVGVNCGEVYYVHPEILPYKNNVLGPNAIMVRSHKYNNQFLSYLFLAKEMQVQLTHITSSMAQPKFNKTNLKTIRLHIPPLSEQQRTVERLDQLSENVKKLQEIQEKTIKECDALKQAILREVFE